MISWLLSLSYWVHLLATIVWLGGLTALHFVAWPAWAQGTLTDNQWVYLQRRFYPWANGSLILLLTTGFYQMSADPNYHGFMAIDNQWAGAILLKHIAFLAMIGFSSYEQLSLYPKMERLLLLLKQKPMLANKEKETLIKQEGRLLRLNLLCAIIVLFFTAIATAI